MSSDQERDSGQAKLGDLCDTIQTTSTGNTTQRSHRSDGRENNRGNSEIDSDQPRSIERNQAYREKINRLPGFRCRDDNQRPTAVDLFCGGGGASIGIEWAGYDLVAAVDTDTDALETHAENSSGYTVCHDLSDIDTTILPERAQSPVYVHGSPPCKGFSNANDDRGVDDPRNSLVFDFIEWVDRLSPVIATMENVTGMLSISNEFMQQVRAAFESAGYEIRWQKLNAADFGVPQTRTRVIVVAVRKDVAVESGEWFPTPSFAESPTQTLDGQSLKQWRSVQDGICDLTKHIHTHRPQGDNNGTSRVMWRDGSEPSHTVKGQGSHAIKHSSSEIRLTDQLNEAHQKAGRRPLQKYSDPSNTIRSSTPPQIIFGQQVGWGLNNRGILTSATRRRGITPLVATPLRNHDPRSATEKDDPFDWEAVEPSETLSGDARLPNKDRASGAKSSRWDGSRRLTVRECARLQSFPDWAVFTSANKTKQYQVVGNAVPPLLMEAVVKKIHHLLEGGEAELTDRYNQCKEDTNQNKSQP